MGTFAETANVNHRLSFADERKQETSVFHFCLKQTKGSLLFPYYFCNKQTKVAVFL
jgi:hypothetical protein